MVKSVHRSSWIWKVESCTKKQLPIQKLSWSHVLYKMATVYFKIQTTVVCSFQLYNQNGWFYKKFGVKLFRRKQTVGQWFRMIFCCKFNSCPWNCHARILCIANWLDIPLKNNLQARSTVYRMISYWARKWRRSFFCILCKRILLCTKCLSSSIFVFILLKKILFSLKIKI